MPSAAVQRGLLCAAYAAAAAVCYSWAVLSPTGQWLDAAGLGADVFDVPEESRLEHFGLIRRGLVFVLAGLAAALGIWALIQRKLQLVLGLLLSSLAAVTLAWLLRRVLPRPDLGVDSYDYNTWPSGHTAAACALALVCLRLLPPGLPRRVCSVPAAAIVAVSAYASVTTFAHRPSDTVGAVLLCAAVFALSRTGRSRLNRGEWAWIGGSALLVVLLILAAVQLLGPNPILFPDQPQRALALGRAAAILASACAAVLPEGAASSRSHRRARA